MYLDVLWSFPSHHKELAVPKYTIKYLHIYADTQQCEETGFTLRNNVNVVEPINAISDACIGY